MVNSNVPREPMKHFTLMPLENVMILLKVKMSGVGIVEARGKLGGTVFTKNRSGAACRVKVTPVNHQSPDQQEVRVNFGGRSSAFRSLTQDQINAWNEAAASGFPITNIWGDPVHLTGANLYTSLNLNLAIVGVAAISDPPSAGTVSSPTGLAPAGLAGAATLFANAAFGPASDVVPANTALAVFATAPVSRGVSFVKSKYRLIDFLDAAEDTGTTNLNTAYSDKFGALVAGQKIYMQVVAINKTTGQAGPPLAQYLTVGA